ncbi:MAG: hypothetical protein ACERKS_02190 [Candidatus Bathyarchaeota archaeon]
MSQIVSRIWKPVRRRGAERYLQLTVLSFAASVSLTRLILELTGYPQLGNSTLHIAHVLYGGVILYAASLIPLLYANRWAYTWGAILSGVGVGLFIDEVGKFITQSNDYFFPAAAPIIYAFFLITVLIYFRIRIEPEADIRGELYTVMEILQEVLDHDLEPDEHSELIRRLGSIISRTENSNYKRLAIELNDFVDSDALVQVEGEPNLFDRIIILWGHIEKEYLTETRVRLMLILGFALLGVPSFIRFTGFAMVAFNPLERVAFLGSIASGFPGTGTHMKMWALLLVVLDGALGALLSISSVLLLINRKNWATQLASLSLIVSLVAMNLLLFYVEQFSMILIAAIQYVVLQADYYYQRKYMKKE